MLKSFFKDKEFRKAQILRLKTFLWSLPSKFKEAWAIKTERRIIIGAGVLLLVLLAATIVNTRGSSTKQPEVSFDVHGPGAPLFEANEAPPKLVIEFHESVAKLELVGNKFTNDDILSPKISGEWVWETASKLVFTPSQHWLPGTGYLGKLPEKMFPKEIWIKNFRFNFVTPEFQVVSATGEFYQHPVNPEEKRVVATLRFSHPVDPASLEGHIRMEAGSEVWAGNLHGYSITYNQSKTAAYIHSDTVSITPKEGLMIITIASGIRSTLEGNKTSANKDISVVLPSLYTMFTVSEFDAPIIRNENYEPETVFMFNFSNGATEDAINQNISAWLLPVDRPATVDHPYSRFFQWDERFVDASILAQSQKIQIEPIATDREFSKSHSFKYRAPVGRYIYMRLNKNTPSYGGYRLADEYNKVICVPDYPKELSFIGSGSILTMTGEHKLTLVTRGLSKIKFELGRILPDQLNHLISQAEGDFRSPSFNGNFGPENISERFEADRTIAVVDPRKNQYVSLGLNDFMTTRNGIRHGLFFINAHDDPDNEYSDKRMILVTDLAIMAKSGRDGAKDVFVQSINDGTPVSGATVEVLGKNGLPVATRVTDERGHAGFVSLDSLEHEKTPVAYVARKGQDISFMPYNWSDRELRMSRFDIGGASEKQSDTIEAFLFSDRGIYRPGDKINFGAILKGADWSQSLARLPFEAVITDSRGAEVYARPVSPGPGGFLELSHTTDETSPTGTYTASIYIIRDNRYRQLLGATTVKVEEFQPDRMKIAVRFSKTQAEGWVSPENLAGTVNLQNLFGIPAAKNRVEGRLVFSPLPAQFQKYPDYTFFDPKQSDKTFTEVLGDKETDDEGNAEFQFNLSQLERASYMLRFQADAFEKEGGRSVGGEASVLVSPLAYMLGYKPDGEMTYIHKDSVRTVRVIAIGPTAKQVPVKDLSARLYEEKYVSVLTKQENGTYKYESILREIPLKNFPVSIPQDGYVYHIPTAAGGDFRLSIKDAKETELISFKFNVADASNITRSLDRNAELMLNLSKTDFAPNENLEFQIKAPYAGAGLITIERDKVYSFKWLKTKTTSSVQSIKVPEGIEGNGYLCVSFIRDIGSKEIFASPLSYACKPFTVSRSRRINDITLVAPTLAKPGEPFKIKYKSSRPGRVVIYAVDEGILQVAAYQLPDPLSFFFRKRALSVRTMQIMDLIMPEFKVVQSVSASGGDQGTKAIGKNLNPFKRKRDRPVAYWSGIIPCDQTEREVVYNVPDYFNGSLKVMAVSVSDSSIGTASSKSTIRGPLVITANMPLVVAPGDVFELSAAIANTLSGSGANAPVTVSVTLPPQLIPLNGTTRTLAISENREETVKFLVKATDTPGNATAVIKAVIGQESVTASPSASIRPITPYRVSTKTGVIKNAKATEKIDRTIIKDYRKLKVSAAPLPLVLANGLGAYLEAYPYGCTEQLVSKAFAALVLSRSPAFEYSRDKAASLVEVSLQALTLRQNESGMFGTWAANNYLEPIHTPYAMHFLTEAQEAGYPIPRAVFAKGLKSLMELGRREPSSLITARVSAYALYVQARNGILVTNDLETLRNRLRTSPFAKEWQQDMTGLMMSATYRLIKQDRVAQDLISSLSLGNGNLFSLTEYYDPLVMDGFMLYIIAKHFPEHLSKLDPSRLLTFANMITQEKYNSFSSAISILGLDAMASASAQAVTQNFSVRQILPGKNEQPVLLPNKTFGTADFSPDAKSLVFENSGDRLMFYQAYMSGYDTAPAPKEIKNGLEIFREYRNEKGEPVTEVNMGDKLQVRLRLRAQNGATLRNIAVVDLLPGGFEIVNERMAHTAVPSVPEKTKPAPGPRRQEYDEGDGDEGPQEEAETVESGAEPSVVFGSPQSSWRPEYADVREDRVVLYGEISQDKEFIYTIQAANRGTFRIPPAFCQSMYDRTVDAEYPYGDKTITVK